VQAVRHVSVNGIFNIAGGAPISMKDLAHRIARVVGKPGATVCASGCPDHQEEYRARFSIRRAGESLGWKPAIPLEQGIREWAAQLADSER
jgi:nucleoside-diphosphate-sugar epimerase